MMEPRSIDPRDIRLGDTVRAEANMTTVEGEVTGFVVFRIGIGSLLELERGIWSWTLLDRPEPPREAGSRWRDPETGARYVLDSDGDYYCYAGAPDHGLYCGGTLYRTKAGIIARLVPLDGPDA